MLELKLAKNKMENEEGMNHLFVKVNPEISTEKVEKPIAFVLVLDVSGSMDGYIGERPVYDMVSNFQVGGTPFFPISNEKPIKQEYNTKLSYVKQASEKLVDMMKDGDMLGVVSFSDSASLEFPLSVLNQDVRFKLKDRIRALSTRGMTNVSDGLEMAYRQVPEELKKTHHIKLILLSDGHANFGITNADDMGTLVQKYQQNDVSVSTVGVGDDYNSYFMEIIATTSGGMFYHLTDMAQLNDIFTKELETLTSLTTKQATLTIQSGKDILLEENLNGFKEEEKGKIFLGNVFSTQSVLTEIFTEKEISVGNRTILVKLEYTNAKDEKVIIEKSIDLAIVKEDEMNDVKTDNEVVDFVKKMMEAKTKKEALRAYEVGNVNDATSFMNQSKLKMKSMETAYSMNFDAEIKQMDNLSNSMTTRSLDKGMAKEMYSQSYNLTRSVDKDKK